MLQSHAEMITADIRRLGYVASPYRMPDGWAVRCATPWGTESFTDYRQWLLHQARGHQQTPESAEDVERRIPKYGGTQ